MLTQDNPYKKGFITDLGNGDLSLDRFPLNYVKSPGDKVHTLTEYDNASDLAFDYWGSSKWWWVLVDVNNLENGFELGEAGTNIIIPDLNKYKLAIL